MGFNYPLPEQVRETAVLNCDGVSTTYGPFDFKIFDEADITVYRKRTGEALYSILTTVTVTKQAALPFDYFTITFPSVEPATTKFKVSSERVHSRSIGVDRGTGLNVDALDKELSKQATVLQELVRNFSTRTVQVDVGQVALFIDPGIVDGDTLMKSGNRLVKGASATEISNAQSYAVQALASKNDAAASAVAAQVWNPANYYTKTQSDTNYYTKTQSDTNYYTKAQVDPKQVFATKAANYTAVVADNNAFHAFSAATTLTLTAPGALGASWHYDGFASGGAVTITPVSGLINGVASLVVPQGSYFSLKCDATNFTCIIDVTAAGGIFTGPVDLNGLIRFGDPTTNTKKFKFDISGITAGQTRTITLPDKDLTLRDGQWELIQKITISGNPSVIDVTNLSAYDRIRISGFAWASVDASNLGILYSTDNGVTFPAPANSYTSGYIQLSGTATVSGNLTPSSQYAYLAAVLGTTAASAACFSTEVFAFNKASITHSLTLGMSKGGAPNLFYLGSQATALGAVACNALRMFSAGGTFAGGTIVVEGIKG